MLPFEVLPRLPEYSRILYENKDTIIIKPMVTDKHLKLIFKYFNGYVSKIKVYPNDTINIVDGLLFIHQDKYDLVGGVPLKDVQKIICRTSKMYCAMNPFYFDDETPLEQLAREKWEANRVKELYELGWSLKDIKKETGLVMRVIKEILGK